jgi:Type ISP C-terminal specificity domain/N-6 DNA Methylase
MPQPTAVDFLREYFSRMADIHGTGGATKETSYYSALENLLNRFGADLRPRVICNGQLRNDGAGNPDFGLYTRGQVQGGEPRKGQIPERGVIEVKGLAEQTWQTADSAQASKYFGHYRLVLITNYRDFRLIGADSDGKAIEFEKYTFAKDESTFWAMTAKPSPSAHQHAIHFEEFIRRVMMTAAPLVRAEDIAWFLASYAKDALATVNEKDASNLEPLRKALETALGIRFEGKDGIHFFKSTLIQTLFYGVFSAWAVHVKQTNNPFDWKAAAYTLTVPMVKALFEQIATPSKLGALGLMPVLDRTTSALNRVDKAAFFKTFDTGAAVQHFYEPFLQAFDPELRKALGVWYTPPEIVTYMVERVDRVLRTELGRPDGLADKAVYILDPCCGTGTYLVAVLRRIEETIRSQGADALLADDIRQAAKERVFGFELLSAPFVVAHWRVGNYLAELGAPLDAAHGERAAIYLTNALTGWEPPSGPKAALPNFPEMALERDAAEHVKLEVPILVILGNPPYNAFAGTSPAEEGDLVEAYKEGLVSKWGIKKFNLDELYARFYRIAERRINNLGCGIVAYISNYSFVSEQSFVVMREKLLQTFDNFWIENMHGDRNKTEYAPDGRTSETIFAIHGFSPGIRQGIVTTLAVKTGKKNAPKIVRFRDDIDSAKAADRREQLLETLNDPEFDSRYELANPEPFNRYSFRPRQVTADFRAWPTLQDIAAIPAVNGLMEKRGGELTDVNRSRLQERMKIYFDASLEWENFKAQKSPLSKNAARFDAAKTRKRLIHLEGFKSKQIVRYCARPFDFQWCYYSGIRPLWNEPRPQLWDWSRIAGNKYLVSRQVRGGTPEGPPFYFLTCIGDDHALRTDAYFFPMRAHENSGAHSSAALFSKTEITNLSPPTRAYIKKLGFTDPDGDENCYSSPWWHALAIGFSPKYLSEHSEGIAIGWPRIPMPTGRDDFDHSAALGKRVAHLLDADVDVAEITSGSIAEHHKIVGVLSATNLVVRGWGHIDGKGRVNPGKGRVEKRNYSASEADAIRQGVQAIGIDEARAFELLGPPVDVYLNETTCWRCVPTAVWEYFIGGYQVIKKWLSYREDAILGRPLTKDEAREVTGMIRRISAILLLTDVLDANYVRSKDTAYPWSTENTTS